MQELRDGVGQEDQAFEPASLSRDERARAEAWLPESAAAAALWAVASMELGAQVCIATGRPACGACPVAAECAWRAAGYPGWSGPARRGQTYAGTDRQCRGVLLGVLRDADGAVPRDRLLAAWSADPVQAERALASLLADGLVRSDADGLRL